MFASQDADGVSTQLAERVEMKDADGTEREKIHTSAFHATGSYISSSNIIRRQCSA